MRFNSGNEVSVHKVNIHIEKYGLFKNKYKVTAKYNEITLQSCKCKTLSEAKYALMQFATLYES